MSQPKTDESGSVAEGIETLRHFAAVNARVLGVIEQEHGQLLARVAYEVRHGSQVVEVIHVGRGLGLPPGEEFHSPRELARLAVSEHLRRAWRLPAGARPPLTVGPAPVVMGILNVTADSFSDGGRFADPALAAARGLEMLAEGAHWLDIGGESTRPGAQPVSLQEELDRVLPVIAALAAATGAPLSVDTSKAEVARQAVAAGASIVNDVTALRGDPEMAGVVAAAGVPVILMHMRGSPQSMQESPEYEDVTVEVCRFLREAILRAAQAGIPPERILVDPGIGFGKTTQHNLTLLERLGEFRAMGRPILVGASRKSFLGEVLGLGVGARAQASALTHTLACQRGAAVVRVHDVRETCQALRLLAAHRSAGTEFEINS